MLENIYNS